MLGLKLMAHIVLLFLVTGEDADLLQVRVKKMLQDGGAEGAGPAGDHKSRVVKCGHF